MAADTELLKEVTKELWKTVYKLRPNLDKQTRLQLVLKALITIGDLPDHVEAAMVVSICSEMDESEFSINRDVEVNSNKTNDLNPVDAISGRKVVRRSSAK